MPESVEMPAPVSTTMRSAAPTQPRTRSIERRVERVHAAALDVST